MLSNVKRLPVRVLATVMAMSLITMIAIPVPVVGVPGSFDVFVNIEAETSIALEKDTDNVIVVTVYIDRIKDPDTETTELIPGGVGSYTATATADPSGIEILGVRGVSPYDNPTFNPGTGEFSVASVAAPEQPTNSPVAKLVVRLIGDCLTPYNLNITFQEIIAASDPGLNVPEENPNSSTFLRGDAKEDGVTNIVDAMFIAQYTVLLRTLSELNPINTASVKYDGSGDTVNIVDAMFVAQYTVGLRDSEFN